MKKNTFKLYMAIAAAAVLLICTAGCTKKNTEEKDKKDEAKTFIDIRDDGGAVASFDKTEKGTAGGTGITIDEGKYLALDTDLTEGSVHVRVIRSGADINVLPTQEKDKPAAIDYVFTGAGTTEYMLIEPGNYIFSVEVEEKATGTITAYMKTVPGDTSSESTEDSAQAASSVPFSDN